MHGEPTDAKERFKLWKPLFSFQLGEKRPDTIPGLCVCMSIDQDSHLTFANKVVQRRAEFKEGRKDVIFEWHFVSTWNRSRQGINYTLTDFEGKDGPSFAKTWPTRITLRWILPPVQLHVILSIVEKKLLPSSSNSLNSGLSNRPTFRRDFVPFDGLLCPE